MLTSPLRNVVHAFWRFFAIFVYITYITYFKVNNHISQHEAHGKRLTKRIVESSQSVEQSCLKSLHIIVNIYLYVGTCEVSVFSKR